MSNFTAVNPGFGGDLVSDEDITGTAQVSTTTTGTGTVSSSSFSLSVSSTTGFPSSGTLWLFSNNVNSYVLVSYTGTSGGNTFTGCTVDRLTVTLGPAQVAPTWGASAPVVLAMIKMPRSKLVLGALGTDGGDVSSSNPLPSKLTDGTSAVAVKPASTKAVSADPSLVVQVNPNQSPFPVQLLDYNSTGIQATVSRELKVAQLYTLADLTAKYELDSRLWDYVTATGGTVSHVPTQSALRVAVTGSSGSTADLLTNTFYKYQAGYTQFISISMINSDTGQTNQVRQWGYFDDNDGLFFQVSGTAVSIVERTSVSGSAVGTTYAQASWNIDPLNGTGASGVTLDVSKGNIYEIEFQWFGVGTTRYFINGILVHEVKHANALLVAYMRTAHLPVRMRVTNTGASSAGSLTLVCARVAAQGQTHDPFEWVYSAGNTADKLISVTESPVLSIRPKATFNSIVNRSWLLPHTMSISTDGYKIRYKLVANGTLTSASWVSAGTASAAEYDVSATAVTGGDTIFQDFIPTDTGSGTQDLSSFFDVFGRILRIAGFAGTGANVVDVLTVVAVNEAVGSTKVRSNLAWSEIK